MDTLINNIRSLVDSSVVKFNKTAKDNETLDSTRNADTYISAMMETDSFRTYANFDIEALENAGLKEPEYDLAKLSKDKNLIPQNKRDAVVKAQRKFIIDTYVELNNYYRMLNGQPDKEITSDKFVYLDESVEDKYEIPHGTPLHRVDKDILAELELTGEFKKAVAAATELNKSRTTAEQISLEYLNHLGHKSIPLLTAREALNFMILRIDKNVPEEFYTSFLTIYDQCREYFTSVLYNSEYSAQYDYYDNFMGLCIMIMTIQRIIANTFKYGIQRDFYDWSFIQAMYKMYNIPFIEDLSMDYHMILLKNLNHLLRYKSTDKVLFDICSLLGHERMNIFKYYLIKQHRLDQDGNPIFYYNKIVDEEGNVTYEEDKERMYQFYFQAVNLRERNITQALLDKKNKMDYREVTISDPYWWEDDDLNHTKFDTEFNYIETKYLSLNLMYKMTEMLFEITYVFRMMMDKKEDLSKFKMALPKIYQEKEFDLYDVIIFLICLTCKKNGFKSYTITTPSKTSHIYGFNFNPEDIKYVKEIINDNKDLVDPEILKYFRNLDILQASDINRLFEQIREFNDYIVDKMATTHDVRQYEIYRKIFTIMIVSETQTDMFTIKGPDGEEKVATSYLEYLKYSDPILGMIAENVEPGDIGGMIDHILVQINDMVESLQYLFLINGDDSPVFMAIAELLRFFKSYTVDLRSFNILYLFDSRVYNMIKIFGDIYSITANMQVDDEMRMLYFDEINKLSVGDSLEDFLSMHDEYNQFITIYHNDKNLILRDRLLELRKILESQERMRLPEDFDITVLIDYVKSILNMDDKFEVHVSYDMEDTFQKFIDLIWAIFATIKYHDRLNLEDIPESISIYIDDINDILNLIEEYTLHGRIEHKDINLKIFDKLMEIITHIDYNDTLNISYSDDIEKFSIVFETMKEMITKREWHREYIGLSLPSDKMTFWDKIVSTLDEIPDLFSILHETDDIAISKMIAIRSVMTTMDTLTKEYNIELDDFLTMLDDISFVTKYIGELMSELTISHDVMYDEFHGNILNKDPITYVDFIFYVSMNMMLFDQLRIHDTIFAIKDAHISDSMHGIYKDIGKPVVESTEQDNVKMRDSHWLIWEN